MWSKLKKQIWEWRGVIIAAPSAAGLVLGLRLLGLLQPLEWSAYDQFFRSRSPEPIDQRILIVGIDERDIRTFKQWPISDTTLTQLLEKLKAEKPRAIGLDVVRDLPVEPGSKALEQLFKITPNLFGAEKLGIEQSLELNNSKNQLGNLNSAIAPPPILKELNQIGAVNFVVDSDGKVRRGLLSLGNSENRVLPSMAMQLSLVYLNEEKNIAFPDAINPPRLEPNDGGYVHVDNGGHQILLNYRNASFTTVSLNDVISGRVPSNLIRDRVVLIGVTAASLKDFFPTPLNGGLGADYDQTSGVEIHAHLVSHLLGSALDGRTAIKTWNDYLEGIWIFAWTLVGAIVSWRSRYCTADQLAQQSSKGKLFFWKPSPPVMQTINILVAIVSLSGISYLAFLSGWWIPFVPALLGLGGVTVGITSYLAHNASKVRACFSRYLTDEVVASILETPEGLRFGGDRRTVTILMCDLRGFSSISEQIPPEKVVEILNIFLGRMTDIINKYQGTIDEFIGDAILVIFGAPINREDDAARAIACAVEMQKDMQTVNQQITELGLPSIAMGVGINTGEVVVGNIGSNTRAKYAVVGSNVNLTGRIESYTLGGQILISESTLKSANINARIDGQMQVEPKGVKEPITLYDIGGIGGKYNKFLPEKQQTLKHLREPIPLYYRVLEEKYLGSEIFQGKFIKISSNSAEIASEQDLPIFKNIKIHFHNHSTEENEESANSTKDFYAKVLENPSGDKQNIYIYFTITAPEITDWLKQVYESHTV